MCLEDWMCIQPPMHPTLVVPDPSPRVRASDTVQNKDDILIAYLQSFQRNHALLASNTALPQGNVIVEAPHTTTTTEQAGPSCHMQPMHETILGYIHASLASGSPHRSIPCLHEIEV
jgi:hypothetical protein